MCALRCGFAIVILAMSGVCTPTMAQGTPLPGAAPGTTPTPSHGPTWETRRPPNPVAPPVRMEPAYLDLGDLAPEARASGIVRVTNTSAEPLTVEAVRPSCLCSVATLDERTLDPGQSAELKVGLTAQQALGVMDTGVDIFVGGFAQPLRARVVANVNYGIRADVSFEPDDQRRTGRITLASVAGSPFKVLSVNLKAPAFLDGFDPIHSDARAGYVIAWDLTGIAPESLPRRLIIETDDAQSPIIDLEVENLEYEPPRQVWPWSFGTPRVLLGVVKPGEQREVSIPIKAHRSGPAQAELAGVEPASASVTLVQTLAVDSGFVVRLSVGAPEKTRGAFVIKAKIRMLEREREIEIYGRAVGDDAGH